MAVIIRLITLDPEYLSDYSTKLKKASEPIRNALELLKKAKMSKGWLSSARDHINNEIEVIIREVNNTSNDAANVASNLTKGVEWFNNWERDTRNRENELSADLSKTWNYVSSQI
jgi:hypothetical protein